MKVLRNTAKVGCISSQISYQKIGLIKLHLKCAFIVNEQMTPSKDAFIKDNELLSHGNYYGTLCAGLRSRSHDSLFSPKIAKPN